MELPKYDDTAAWQQIRRESPIFVELLIHPRYGNACPRCDWSRLSGKRHDFKAPGHVSEERLVGSTFVTLAKAAVERNHGVYLW